MNINEYIKTTSSKDRWTHIIIHHSATSDGQTVDWDSIRKYHKEVNGWEDIGYHFGIERVGDKFEYKVGRGLDKDGAHTRGINQVAVGVCLIGDYDLSQPSHEQYLLLAVLCKSLMERFGITICNIHPHNSYADKTCPGTNLNLVKLKYEYIKIL